MADAPNALDETRAAPPFWASGRGRKLLGLAGGTVVLVLAAILVVSRDAAHNAVQFTARPIFPGFEAKQAAAGAITIADKERALHIKKTAQGRWVVSEAHDYPASGERLHELFLALSELTAVARKTARPDWQAELGLVAPNDGGTAVAITVADAAGQTLAGVLVGRLQPPTPAGGESVFVREIGQPQAYLAEGELPVETTAVDWVEQAIVDLPRDRVRRVALTPASGPPYALVRQKPEDVNFALETVPPGREMMSETAANGLGAGAIAIVLEDVRPAAEVDFSGASRIAYDTFDGLSVAFDVVKRGEVSWLRATALAAPAASATVTAEAAAISARTTGWAYAIADWKASLFTKPLESLLKSPEAPKADTTPQKPDAKPAEKPKSKGKKHR